MRSRMNRSMMNWRIYLNRNKRLVLKEYSDVEPRAAGSSPEIIP